MAAAALAMCWKAMALKTSSGASANLQEMNYQGLNKGCTYGEEGKIQGLFRRQTGRDMVIH